MDRRKNYGDSSPERMSESRFIRESLLLFVRAFHYVLLLCKMPC